MNNLIFINTNNVNIYIENAYEVPDKTGIRIENTCIVETAIDGGLLIGFDRIINGPKC